MSKIPMGRNPQKDAIFFSKRIEALKETIQKNKKISDQKYKALQDFLRLLSNFASHDIKNAIHNMDGLLSTVDSKSITDENIEMLSVCLKNIRSSLDEFQNLSKENNKHKFTVLELTSALQSLHRAILKKNKIKFNINYSIDKNTEINHQFHNILQVLNNLIINSFEFIDTDLADMLIEIDVLGEDNFIKFIIKDTGKGIPKENEDKIFLAYFTTKENGTGVGLAHVKYIMDHIGGEITYLKNDEKFKTIFELKIPIDEKNSIDN